MKADGSEKQQPSLPHTYHAQDAGGESITRTKRWFCTSASAKSLLLLLFTTLPQPRQPFLCSAEVWIKFNDWPMPETLFSHFTFLDFFANYAKSLEQALIITLFSWSLYKLHSFKTAPDTRAWIYTYIFCLFFCCGCVTQIPKASMLKKNHDYETLWKGTVANVTAAKNHYDFNMLLPLEVTILTGWGNSCSVLLRGREGLENVESPFDGLMSCWKACQPYLHFNLHVSPCNALYSGSALKSLLHSNHSDLCVSPFTIPWGLQPQLAQPPRAWHQEMSGWVWHLSQRLVNAFFFFLLFFPYSSCRRLKRGNSHALQKESAKGGSLSCETGAELVKRITWWWWPLRAKMTGRMDVGSDWLLLTLFLQTGWQQDLAGLYPPASDGEHGHKHGLLQINHSTGTEAQCRH